MKNMKLVGERAKELWESMDDNQKTGCRFGMFPHEIIKGAEDEGYDSHALICALMDCASENGGMRA